MREDEANSKAALVSADPAFTALEASGAPIVVVMGEPLCVVYANRAATTVFGEDGGARLLLGSESGSPRLAAVIERLRHTPAPRLERIPISFASGAQTITILCRRIHNADEEPCFVIAALGLRPAALDAPSPPVPDAPPARDSRGEAAQGNSPCAALRARLAEKYGAGAHRFLWKTDADGKFTEVTRALSEVAGEKYADLIGRSVDEVSRALLLGPAFATALAAQQSWSGVTVDWPIEDPRCRAPATLGGLPIVDADRRFQGFHGFGVLRLSQAKPWNDEAVAQSPGTEAQPPAEAARANVVALRPSAAQGREQAQSLSPLEQSAFEEIARTLNAASGEIAPPPPGPARELIDHIARALEGMRAPLPPRDADFRQASTLLDLLPLGVVVARGDAALYANRTLLDYLGYADLEALTADGGLGQLFLGGVAARTAEAAPKASGAVAVRAQSGETLEVDAHIQTIDWHGEAATLISLRRLRAAAKAPTDETARARDAETARLAAEKTALAAAFDASGEPAALLTDDGRVKRANAAFASLFGQTPTGCAEQRLQSFLGGSEAQRLSAYLAHAKETGDAAPAAFTARGPQTGVFGVQLALRRLAAGAEPVFVCQAARDADEATSAARAEAEAARAEAERASAAKSDFLARVSHEIRTPLNAIIGFAEVMIEERFGPLGCERYKEYLRDIHNSGAHVLSLVNDLLDLSKIEAGKMELSIDDVDVNAAIGECVSIMQTQANQQKVIVRLSLAPGLPRIRADERSLRQILLNLISNAVKFNDPGGQVIISSAANDAGHVVVRVKDTGIGMSEAEITLALEPFRQVAAARASQGTGLGLPVTKALVEANHASMLIKSRKNEGTLIEVAFPAAQSLAAE